MCSRLYDTGYRDVNDNRIVWSNNVISSSFYSTVGESWDLSGGGSTSWYLEDSTPSDFFYGTNLATDRWSWFNYRGTVSGTISDGLALRAENGEIRGGLSSQNKWVLSGNFDIKLYIDESSYYNEYRSDVACGVSVSISDSYKYRISKYFDGSAIGFKSEYVDGKELKYYSWFDNGGMVPSSINSGSSCLRIIRDSSGISSFVDTGSGFCKVGSTVSGIIWEEGAYVELELETAQANTAECSFNGVSVSGTVYPSTTFTSCVRGTDKEFPVESVFIVDSLGMSVVDVGDMSLWMRFELGDTTMFRDSGCSMSAGNGRLYYTSVSGLYCIDFSNDSFYRYIKGSRQDSGSCLSERNFSMILHDSIDLSFLPDNQVNDVCFRHVGGNDYLAVATVSGLDILVNDSVVYSSIGRNDNISKVEISSMGKLVWSQYDQVTNTGRVYYLDNVSSLPMYGGGNFGYTGYYDSETSSVALSSEKINGISCSVGGDILLANEFGIDYIGGCGCALSSYGSIAAVNPILDPTFGQYIGSMWHLVYSTTLPTPAIAVSRSTDWSTVGLYSLRLASIVGTHALSMYNGGVYQQVDFSLIDRIYFDFMCSNTSDSISKVAILEVLAGETVLATINYSIGTISYSNYSVDCSNITGVNQLVFRLKYLYSGLNSGSIEYFIDNIRTFIVEPDHKIIPSHSQEVLSVSLFEVSENRKAYFSCVDGYGVIDLDSDTLDYYNFIDTFVSGATINNAEYALV